MFISFRCDDYMYSHLSSAPPKLDMHSHKYYEFLYFNSGDAAYVVGDRTYRAEPGDLFVTAPDETHCIMFNSNAHYKRHFIQVSEEMMKKVPYNIRRNLIENICGHRSRIPAQLVKRQHLGSYFQLVSYNIPKKTELSDFMIRTYIYQLIAMLSAIDTDEIDEYANEKKIITDIKNYISERADKTLTLDAIAADFFMSKYYLCHIFREETGTTIKDYINVQKIARACELIRGGTSAADTQRLCGFNDYSTFYRTFKKYMGYSPAEI